MKKKKASGATPRRSPEARSAEATDAASHADSAINLWLDDVRDPASFGCSGWVWAKTVAECIPLLRSGRVVNASLDHDLGACAECFKAAGIEHTGDIARDWAAWLTAHEREAAPNCSHVGTGYDLIVWMERTGHWPKNKPRVHSVNPVGRARMRQAIDRSFMCPTGSGNHASEAKPADGTRRSGAP